MGWDTILRHDGSSDRDAEVCQIARKGLRQIIRKATAEVHATNMKRLSKIETADDPTDGAGDE